MQTVDEIVKICILEYEDFWCPLYIVVWADTVRKEKRRKVLAVKDCIAVLRAKAGSLVIH